MQDRLSSYGPFDYTYGANGELSTKTNRQTSDAWLYQYDALGNLLSVRLPNGDLVEYLVDGLGRRVGKKLNGSVVKRWLYRDSLKPAAELDGSGALVAQFVYASKPHVPDFVRRGAATYRVISDHLGSPRYVVNVNDQNDVPYRADYSSFGSVSGTGLDWMPFGFAGGLYDGHSGLVRFGARDYDPAVGRWTSKEPRRFNTLGTNLYLYALGDPLNLWDVTGRDVCVFSSAQGYHHRWIEIGGDPNRSYGFWPDNGILFTEGRVDSPDGRSSERSDPETDSTCHEATPEEEDELERWIRENYDVNKPSDRNPYIFGLNDCRHFADDTIDELQRIQRNPWQIATDIFWGLW